MNRPVLAVCLLLAGCVGDPSLRAELEAVNQELATLRARQHALLQLQLCQDSGLAEQLRGRAGFGEPELDCLAFAVERTTTESERFDAGRALQQRDQEAYQAALDSEPRAEPWATETEQKLREAIGAAGQSEELRRYEAELVGKGRVGEDFSCASMFEPQRIQCFTMRCEVAFAGGSGRYGDRCMDAFFTVSVIAVGDLQVAGGRGDPEAGIVMEYYRRGFNQEDVRAFLLRSYLDAEPRDEAWAGEAEALVRTVAASAAQQWQDDPTCDVAPEVECRSVTCRIVVPVDEDGRLRCWRGDPWMNRGMSATGPGPRPGTKTLYLPREGAILEDVRDLVGR